MNRASQIFLLRELVRRDFSSRYAGSLFGFAWSFIQPIWQLLLLSFVFSIIMRADMSQEATSRFWVFLFCGLLPWTAIHEGIMRSASAILEHGEMVKKVAFPAEILVIAVSSTALIHQGITLLVFLVVLTVVGELSWATLYMLPLALAFQVGLTLTVGYFVAAVQVYFRDTVQLLGLVLNAWFFLTPIVYPLSMIPYEVQPWIMVNPLAVLVSFYRYIFLGGGLGDWQRDLAAMIVLTFLVLYLSLGFFRRLKPGFSDEI